MAEKLLFMEIADKIVLSEEKCCPPHYIPHKLPFGKPVDNEPCHTHIASWRKAHHDTFCRILKCPHYQFMKNESENLNK